MPDRRTVLCGLAALPFAGGAVAILGQPTAASLFRSASTRRPSSPISLRPGTASAHIEASRARNGEISTPSYYVRPPDGDGFGDASTPSWRDGLTHAACPDHVERVVAEVFRQCREAAA